MPLKLVIDSGIARPLTGAEVISLDKALRNAIKKLVGWSHSSITGELMLDLGTVDEDALRDEFREHLRAAKGVRILRFEIFGAMVEWE